MTTRPKKQPRLHNPDKLTPEQVNPPVKKYRLLDRDEIKWREKLYKEIEGYCLGGYWNPGYEGSLVTRTYRTTLTRAALAKLK